MNTSDEYLLFEILQKHGVPFVIVGGYAVITHGFVRATEDADVVWIRSTESDLALSWALQEVDAQYIGREIDPATGIERTFEVSLGYIQSHHLMMLCTRYGFLDLFDYIRGFPELDVKLLMDSSIEVKGFKFASLEMLMKMKRAAGRSKDLLDLQKLNELHDGQ